MAILYRKYKFEIVFITESVQVIDIEETNSHEAWSRALEHAIKFAKEKQVTIVSIHLV